MVSPGGVVPRFRPLDRSVASPVHGCPTRPPIGSVLLITADAGGGAIWTIFADAAAPSLAPFGPRARHAWQSAAAAVSRSVPVLWKSPGQFVLPTGPRLLGVIPRHWDPVTNSATPAHVRAEVDGPSFGLSFFLSNVSLCCSARIRRSVAATATVDPVGRVGKVDDRTLADKLAAIADLAPWVTTVFVAAQQQELALGIVRDLNLALEIEAVSRVEEVLPFALSRPPEKLLTSAGRDPARRRAVVDRLFGLSIAFRSALIDWEPAVRACDLLLQRPSPWGALTAGERWSLRFVRAVAARRSNNRGTLPVLRPRNLAAFNTLQRITIVAHYIRHGADTGSPTFDEARELAPLVLPRTGLLPPHARLLGSLARYSAVHGREREAIQLQWKAAELLRHANPEHWPESSHQYSELYRLAGARRDLELFRRVEAVIVDQARVGLYFDHDGSVHVRLARAQALVMMGRAMDALAVLDTLVKCDLVSSNPSSAVLRWRVRALDDLGRTADADRVIGAGEFADPRHPVLVNLDRSIRRQEWLAAEHAIAMLGRIDPGPIRHLLQVAPKRTPARALFVQRLYPY